MAWGVQKGRRRPEAACLAGGRAPKRLGMAGPGETLGSPWPPLPIRLWLKSSKDLTVIRNESKVGLSGPEKNFGRIL
jgi:hypothetical protein